MEIPVTTLPILRVPIHVSYLLYLSLLSPRLATLYYCGALRLCRLLRTTPSLLLHPLDFLGCDDEPDLTFFPAMGMESATKLALVGEWIDILCAQFEVVPMKEHMRVAAESSSLPVRSPLALGLGADFGRISEPDRRAVETRTE
jgi:hypothetical protein